MQHPAPPTLPRPAGRACHVPDARELASTALLNAQAGLREAVRVHDFARREIGQANKGVFCNIVIKNITAERRRALLHAAQDRAPGHGLVFLKAWNEWAEGNHLEPDLKTGHSYLEIVRDEALAASIPAGA